MEKIPYSLVTLRVKTEFFTVTGTNIHPFELETGVKKTYPLAVLVTWQVLTKEEFDFFWDIRNGLQDSQAMNWVNE